MHLIARFEGDQTVAEDQSGPVIGSLNCVGLLQCFAVEDILREEANLKYLGYTSETYPMFCQDVGQSLGGCGSTVSVLGGSAAGREHLATQPSNDDVFTGPNFDRCLPLENYAVALQERSNAGEDTGAEEERLLHVITTASKHLFQGRADLYCNEVSTNLP